MRALYQEWIDAAPSDEIAVEGPPEWLTAMKDRERLHHMEHPKHGRREDVPPSDVTKLRKDGWRFIVTDEDFGELLHVQATYLAQRHFPRLQWITLNAPEGGEFIIGDRPVVWGFEGALDVTPAALRSPKVQLFAPLTPKIALMAAARESNVPAQVTPDDVNRITACAAESWIAGASKEVVLAALKLPMPPRDAPENKADSASQ